MKWTPIRIISNCFLSNTCLLSLNFGRQRSIKYILCRLKTYSRRLCCPGQHRSNRSRPQRSHTCLQTCPIHTWRPCWVTFEGQAPDNWPSLILNQATPPNLEPSHLLQISTPVRTPSPTTQNPRVAILEHSRPLTILSGHTLCITVLWLP